VTIKRVTADDFRKDPMFPRIERTVAAILANGKVVAPVSAPFMCSVVGARGRHL
jgi:hypothetical protein